MPDKRQHGVLLNGRHIGVLHHWEDVVRFTFSPDYWDAAERNVLGLWFDDHPLESPQAALRLPTWFSNLLPEGRMREWVARDRGVSASREMELLLRLGTDLPGGVEIIEDGGEPDSSAFEGLTNTASDHPSADEHSWKFSLAGVGMKFSMLQVGDRLTVPATGLLGDWIVKLPDSRHPHVPQNEFAMMSLAAATGINTPEHSLVSKRDLPSLPDIAWPSGENVAYRVMRFDRPAQTVRVHMEDFCQIRGFYPEQKYEGTFETVASLAYRRHDKVSLQEFCRRMTFNVLIGNGDAHLKNWSLLYRDGRTASLSPAYDLVSTAPYFEGSQDKENLGLKFGGSRRFVDVRLRSFVRLQEKLGAADANLPGVVRDTVERFESAWSQHDWSELEISFIEDWIDSRLQKTRDQLLS